MQDGEYESHIILIGPYFKEEDIRVGNQLTILVNLYEIGKTELLVKIISVIEIGTGELGFQAENESYVVVKERNSKIRINKIVGIYNKFTKNTKMKLC